MEITIQYRILQNCDSKDNDIANIVFRITSSIDSMWCIHLSSDVYNGSLFSKYVVIVDAIDVLDRLIFVVSTYPTIFSHHIRQVLDID